MRYSLCVYASSSQTLAEEHYQAAAESGRAMGKLGFDLVFGAGQVGTMGVIAEAVQKEGGSVTGVIPERLNLKGVVYERCNSLIVTPDMRSRKRKMEELADGFLAMPGGFGTLEELLEIITGKQLGYHQKPIVIYNLNGFYDLLLKQFQKNIRENFAKPIHENLYYVSDNAQEALHYFKSYCPQPIEPKWNGYNAV